jgi:hypothetical protein
MKYLNVFLFLLLLKVSFSQITLTELQNILKMDQSKFETYCLTRGYTFNKVEKGEDFNGWSYTKGKYLEIKHLFLLENWFEIGKRVIYQTRNSSEYLNIKSELEVFGFILVNNEVISGGINKTYKNEIYMLDLFSGKDENENNAFVISLSYLK